ncbi:MAG: Gfo/Idh/MocA family oxidoreductase, partial [Pirellulaceae bacterium]|nr:Gfo/Idh/MocA family oxidoreductase [Pirellulaceae bacterium]
MLPSPVCTAGPEAPSNRFNIALIGCGGRGTTILQEAVSLGANVIALCDADAARIANTRTMLAEKMPAGPAAAEKINGYEDYRQLIDKEKSLDGVLIAIGPWWHAPMSTAFIKAGKHVYCEKPVPRPERWANWPRNRKSPRRWVRRGLPANRSAGPSRSSKPGCWGRSAKCTFGTSTRWVRRATPARR